MEPDELIMGISSEIDKALKGMAKAKTVAEKVQYSEVVKNLCESLGIFLHAAGMAALDDDFDDEDDLFN